MRRSGSSAAGGPRADVSDGPSDRRRRRKPLVLVVCGVVGLAAAVGWRVAVVPQLVRFPLSTNTTLHYSGHLVTYVNQKTGAPLSTPTSVPLTIDRWIHATPSQSSSNVAVVQENLALHYSGKTVHENNTYAINRRTMCNVPSSFACTFSPTNPGAATGSYYVTLPMNLNPARTKIRVWKPETGTTYPLVPLAGGNLHSVVDGVTLTWFRGTLPMTPVAPWEQTALAKRGLPMTASAAQVEAQLAAKGVSVPALTKTLTPVLNPTEAKQVAAVLSAPIALHYYSYGTGLVGAEARTGVMVDFRNIVDGIAVAPDTSGVKVLVSVLSHHATLPGVPAALTALRSLESVPPSPVYALHYTSTPASVQSMASTAKSQAQKIAFAEDYVPVGLGIIGLVLLLAGIAAWIRREPHAEGAFGERSMVEGVGPDGGESSEPHAA